MKRKKKGAPRKEPQIRCACCGLRREDRERDIERIVFESLKRLALAIKDDRERDNFFVLLQVGLDRLLEIDQKPQRVDKNKA